MSRPTPIQQALEEFLRRFAEDPAHVVPRVRRILEVGGWHRHLRHCRLHYRQKTVFIRTQSATVRHDLRYYTRQIRDVLAEALPELDIEAVVIQ